MEIKISLPPPVKKGKLSLEEAIEKRRSIWEYLDLPLELREISQILWAAQGITDKRGFRTAPSAGATYPFEVYIVVKKVNGLKPGIYKYIPAEHSIELIKEGDFSNELCRACLGQVWVKDAAVNIILVAFYERTTWRYGERGKRYVHFEAGHIGQNIYLQATALGLGTVAIGAFYDEEVKRILETEGHPLYIFPVGKIKK